MNKAKKIQADILVTLGMVIFSAYVLYSASGFPKESGVFPKIVSTFVLALSIGQLAVNLIGLYNTSKSEDVKEKVNDKTINKDFWVTIISLLAYPILIFIVGYFPATIIYLAFAIYVYGYKHKMKIALITLGVTVFLYVAFVLVLKVKLPVGFLLGGF